MCRFGVRSLRWKRDRSRFDVGHNRHRQGLTLQNGSQPGERPAQAAGGGQSREEFEWSILMGKGNLEYTLSKQKSLNGLRHEREDVTG